MLRTLQFHVVHVIESMNLFVCMWVLIFYRERSQLLGLVSLGLLG